MRERRDTANTEALQAAIDNLADAKRVLDATFPLLVDRILIATGNDIVATTEILRDVINIAMQTASLALAERRTRAEKYKTDLHMYHNPDSRTARQDSLITANDAVRPLISKLEANLASERAGIVSEEKSPLQKKP